MILLEGLTVGRQAGFGWRKIGWVMIWVVPPLLSDNTALVHPQAHAHLPNCPCPPAIGRVYPVLLGVFCRQSLRTLYTSLARRRFSAISSLLSRSLLLLGLSFCGMQWYIGDFPPVLSACRPWGSARGRSVNYCKLLIYGNISPKVTRQRPILRCSSDARGYYVHFRKSN